MKRGLLGVVVAATMASAPFALGQPRRPAGEGRAEAWKMIDAYIMGNLQESLGLTDEQFVKLLPLVKKLQKDRRDFAQRRRQMLQELRRSLASGSATEAKALEQLKNLKTIETDEPPLILKDLRDVDAALTPIQQAKFRVMEIEIEARIRQMLNRVREQRRLNRNGKAPLPPAEDEDLEP
jgi:Spy/CpxP family protein refolding chaperone